MQARRPPGLAAAAVCQELIIDGDIRIMALLSRKPYLVAIAVMIAAATVSVVTGLLN
ncbi:hypothetical protein RALTA_A0480 [Cupriavidus taiwanensis LMG 19424]|uniref:Uncharacterized protein n=1 Tax=Cupriavidus taiwanensis (strain DSM 17343 / BCRC 17206 / CCUG 44338 / CIP 107171 / LMG 19424 / R1) TaxID=977880 RepID=B2AH99_CUPTR|nr:hypothetical protein RALTA_A0480 [Cupriavidus taiwanensis LMG 19424]SOZ01406.1 hypothetical protein CBM2595_A30276 [Cupriavidus taiwanensis]